MTAHEETIKVLAREVAALRRIMEVKARKVNRRTFAAACKAADLTRAWLALPKAMAATDANEAARQAVERHK